jgi:hypothetical protein
MKRTSNFISAIALAVFLLGSAWLDGAFHVEEIPKFVPEMHKLEKAALHIDDGQDDPPQIVLRINTIITPLTGAMQFNYEQPPPFVRGPLGALVTTLTSYMPPDAISRRMPVVYTAPRSVF